MKLRTIVLSSLVLAAGALGARAAFQEGMAMTKPGPEHEVLKHMAGEWTASVEMMGMKEAGTMKTNLALGGLWAVSDFDSKMMGMAFQGHEIFGWDSAKKKYVSCWVDSTSTNMSITEGDWDAASKTMTLRGESVDPTGTKVEMINKIKVPDADHHTFEMYAGSADGQPMMTITYTRKK